MYVWERGYPDIKVTVMQGVLIVCMITIITWLVASRASSFVRFWSWSERDLIFVPCCHIYSIDIEFLYLAIGCQQYQ